MTFHQFVGIAISLVAVIIALHTKYQQRQKRELNDLGGKLKQLYDDCINFLENTRKPHTHLDFELVLDDIAKELLAYHHETGETPNFHVQKVNTLEKEDGEYQRQKLEDSEEAFEELKNGNHIYIRTSINQQMADFETIYSDFDMHHSIVIATYIFDDISNIKEVHESLILDFDDAILDDIEAKVDIIIENMLLSVFGNKEGFNVDVEKYETTDEIAEEVYENIFFYEGIEKDFDELEDLTEELDDLQTTVLQASYS